MRGKIKSTSTPTITSSSITDYFSSKRVMELGAEDHAEFILDDSWKLLAATMMTEKDHAPSVEGQVKVVVEQSEDCDDWESKDNWGLWGTQEDHESFMEMTLPYLPEPGDSCQQE